MIKPHNIETLVRLHNECIVRLEEYEYARYNDMDTYEQEAYNKAEQCFKAFAQALMEEGE